MEQGLWVDGDNHRAAHACRHLGQLLVPERSGKESFLFPTGKELKHTAKLKVGWFCSKGGSRWALQGSSQTRLCRQEVLPCRRGSMEGQPVALVREADKQMDEAGIAGGAEEASAAVLMNAIRQPQRGTGG